METSSDVSMYFVFPLNRCWNGQKIRSCGPKSAYVVSCNGKKNLNPIRFPNCKKTDQDDDDDDYYADDDQPPPTDDGSESYLTSWDNLLDDDYGTVDHAAIFSSVLIQSSSSAEYTNLMSAELWRSPSSQYQEPMFTDIASCVAQLCHVFTHDGTFETRGDANEVSFYPRLALPILEDFKIQSTIIKDSSCEDHFFTIANSPNGVNFDWNSVPGQVTFVFDCNSKQIHGPTSSSPSQVCNIYDTYVLQIGILNGVASFNDSKCGNISLAVNFTGPYYLYMSADFDQWRQISDDELTGSDRMYCEDSSRDQQPQQQCGIIGSDVHVCGGTSYARKNTKSCPFQVCGGQRVTIDLSICVGDTYLRLFNANGAMITFNDDGEDEGDDYYDDDGSSLCSYLEFALPPNAPCEDLTVVMGCYDDDSCTGLLNITLTDDSDVITSSSLEEINYQSFNRNLNFSCPFVTQNPGQVDVCSFEICSGYFYEISTRNFSSSQSQISLISYDSLVPLDNGISGDIFNFQGFDGCQLLTIYQSCPSSSLTSCAMETHVSISAIPPLQISWNQSDVGIGSSLIFTIFGDFPENHNFHSGLYFVLYSTEVANELESCHYWKYELYDYINLWSESVLPVGPGLSLSYEIPFVVSVYGGSYRILAFYENLDNDRYPYIAGVSPDLIISGQEMFSLSIDPPVPNENIVIYWSSSMLLNESFRLELMELSTTGHNTFDSFVSFLSRLL
jgi:hypothetical protein